MTLVGEGFRTWGRCISTNEIAKSYVKGFQGQDLAKHNTIMACAKHFVGYGASQAGRDYHTVNMGEDELKMFTCHL